MPIRIPNRLPAKATLKEELVPVLEEGVATHQDIRPLQIAVLNLMPEKIKTETQLARLLGNTPLQVELTLLTTKTYRSKNTSEEHLIDFYKTWDQVKHQNFDALIVTGAPLGTVDFEDVAYWDEMVNIMEWAEDHCFRRFYMCWGAMAALYHFHGIDKGVRPQKLLGVFRYTRTEQKSKLFLGLNDEFWMPVGRSGEINRKQLDAHPDLHILSDSTMAGAGFIYNHKTNTCYMMNHPEYDTDTIKDEYERELPNGDSMLPLNYFPDDDPSKGPKNLWRASAHLLFANWLNDVYQNTPYKLEDISGILAEVA